MKKIIVGIVCFIIALVGGYFGLRFAVSEGLIKTKGEISFGEGFSEDDQEKYKALFNDKIKGDLTFSYESLKHLRETNGENEVAFLLDVLVPTTDFYSPATSISKDEFSQLVSSNDASVVSINELSPSRRLLKVDDDYYLDSFDGGAEFKYLIVKAEKIEDLDYVKDEITQQEFPNKENVLSFVQTGTTALSRGMNQKLNQIGDANYFSEKIGGFLSSFDLMHISNESSFSGMASSDNICSDERFFDVIKNIGVDIVELTGNHNLDCGVDDAISTIDKYDEVGIKVVGGGRNLEQAREELKLQNKQNNVTMLAYNQSTGGATDGEMPGANPYSAEDARTKISEAKSRGDGVIVDIQYYECSSYDSVTEDTTCDYADSSAGDQIGLFREIAEMGADVVVGTSAHQTQTFEKYGNSQIYYGLGNLFFDQSWWPGTTRSLGLIHYFYKNKLIQTRLFGTVYDSDLQTRLMTDEELNQFVTRLSNARPE